MSQLICYCFFVSEAEIRAAIVDHGANTVEAIGAVCNACRGCGCCRPDIEDMLREIEEQETKSMTNAENAHG